MDVEGYLAECSERVDAVLEAELPPPSERPGRLHAAMRHLLFPGGKRFRPALVMAACQAAGGQPERAAAAAAAVELVHTYSLVHDDLPCMDDDALRRGRPTVHVAFDEATAVLAGDALLAEAFRVLLADDALDAATARAAARELARTAGSRELVGGQAEDLAAGATAPPSADDIEWIHLRKTAALIRTSVLLGAQVAGAGAATLQALRRFGERVGLAFQIADDLLDAGDEGEQGSLVPVAGAEAARARAEQLLAEALALVEALGEPAEPLRELARMAVRRTI